MPLRYSILGRYERTPPPNSPAVFERGGSWVRVGWCSVSVPLVRWRVHAEGLAFSIFGFGKFFVPREAIRSVSTGRMSGLVKHACEEVRGPIKLPNVVAQALEGTKDLLPTPSA